MVAAVCSWHERHEQSRAGIERRLRRGERLTVAAHALVEAYAVLTRLPAPHRLTPADAWALVGGNFGDPARIVTLDAEAYVSLLGELAASGIAGGRSYDALIAECASRGGASTLLTLNRRHFDPAPPGVRVEEP